MQYDYKIKADESIFDVANNTLKTLDNIYSILLDNASITSIDYDLNNIATQNVKYNGAFVNTSAPELYLNNKGKIPTFSVNTLDNQSIYDVCIQETGTLDGMVNFLINNEIINLNYAKPGIRSVFLYNTDIKSNGITKAIKNRGLKLATLEEDLTFYPPNFLLLEDGFYILLESGGKIILE